LTLFKIWHQTTTDTEDFYGLLHVTLPAFRKRFNSPTNYLYKFLGLVCKCC